MLQIPFKMEWSQSFPKARKVRKTLDPDAWEKLANPRLIRMLAAIFIIPGYILALLLIIMALCNWNRSASPHFSPPTIHSPAAIVPSASGNKAIALADGTGHTTFIMDITPARAVK